MTSAALMNAYCYLTEEALRSDLAGSDIHPVIRDPAARLFDLVEKLEAKQEMSAKASPIKAAT